MNYDRRAQHFNFFAEMWYIHDDTAFDSILGLLNLTVLCPWLGRTLEADLGVVLVCIYCIQVGTEQRFKATQFMHVLCKDNNGQENEENARDSIA